jgi:uncharacterized RDD family membrane protein YckC
VGSEQWLLIESLYGRDQLETASRRRRFAANLIDTGVVVFTLVVGWLIWFSVVAPRGQSPGKQLLHLYIIRDDGTRAGGRYTWLRDALVKQLLFGAVLSSISGGHHHARVSPPHPRG